MYDQKKLEIFIGYDEVERVAWHTLTHSIINKSTIPLTLRPSLSSILALFYSAQRSKTV